ncbi:hypothetical protein VHA01S_018_00240 [Vibrio halioticoli NBRC 102217]|uniref:Uncharacterized protein n=1 Tax=Vibrio halioticoli NBRC 102217 TaxID=1219072 RepID=V5HIT0_9VIBR|nr:hypothetical protein [Vibrio halioticoli]GAD89235.1 hypothetical protein VHA01S_018_00240 [Vibrio halioticoli NBRC 102217]
MMDSSNHEMAVDMLRCHLGMSKQEALEELGLEDMPSIDQQVVNSQSQVANDA